MKAAMAWSGGKDSAVALWRLQQEPQIEVVGLLTTLTEGYNRVTMQGVRRELLEAQSEALGIRVYPVWIPPKADNDVYESRMGRAVDDLRRDDVEAVAFGDLFLEDVRAYRERMMARTGLRLLFPIWGEDTRALSRRLLADGFRAIVTCVDPRTVPAELAGRHYDATLLDELPPGVDPCGENGEMHTFVHRAPNFRHPIPVTVGERVERDGFVFADVLPAGAVAGD